MSRKILIVLIVALTALIASAADKPQIKFTTTTHDFGQISAGGGKVKAEFEFTNTGNAPLVIVSVTNGGCGCTVPQFPREPIAPGKKGVVTIMFNPAGRSGEFQRVVKVRTNAGKRQSLSFSGVVIPDVPK